MKKRIGAGGALAVLLLASCGDDTSDEGTTTDADPETAEEVTEEATDEAAAAPEGEWPVEIDHAFGATTIEQRPERVVTLDVQWTDVMLEMGVEPAGYAMDEAGGQEGIYPWQEGELDDATEIVVTDGIPYEQVAALEPDLILVTHLAVDEEVFGQLEAIAPTVGLLGDRQVDRWQDQAEVAGQILGDPDQAADVVAGVDDVLADTAADLPELEGRTFSLVNYIPGDAIYVVADPEDGSSVFFQALGMELNPGLDDSDEGRVQLSTEEASRLDSDLLVLFSHDGDPSDLPGYDDLPAVTNDAVAELNFDLIVGLNTPTPRSIPFVLDDVLPALEAVAGS